MLTPSSSRLGNVKGSVLRSRLAFVSELRGGETLERVLARLTEQEQAILGGTLMPFVWYPFEINLRLDAAIAAELGGGDEIFRAMGAKSAEHNLTSASQRRYVDEKNPQALLKSTSAIYSVYYDTGRREYEKVSETSAILRTYESLSFASTDCLSVAGWYERAIAMCGGRNARVAETRCRVKGDAVCEYVLEWEMDRRASTVPPPG